jgi:dephospho-CoA kinase
MERDGSSEADARARMAAQMPLEAKARLADVVLDNNGSLEALERQVGGRWRGL